VEFIRNRGQVGWGKESQNGNLKCGRASTQNINIISEVLWVILILSKILSWI
jgi:hypothetical protein